ncbi:hypothetical protein CGRA01v4_07237 [Colletotrichum graminicola]|uniref:Uncharacterized protein n=1 Tax=Colletotrichum graminicola (strain M1.001 / M2 / FGSC 10212) TaxID=645133 RepID=E3QCG7_COLGM|nr:uncharacterized protein GLRG_03699 [Colletotrichum graminicola M1.001]EFQ28555.1 hypothetical protein GLRG_03699 [Colletotrichum graminicola M1.001]WDK15955.1 hypothetical protein CGRA01v4_07237 [Colletotrichum graminicola]
MPYVTCNPDAPSGPWTATIPCPVCYEARKVRERPGTLRRLLGTSRRLGPASPPSVCSECGSAGRETTTFSEPNWNPEHRVGRRVEEPVGPANETRADDVFGPPTPLGRPASMWARLKPLEDHPYFAVPDAQELAWAKAIRKAQKCERAASDVRSVLRVTMGRLLLSRGPMLTPVYEEHRARSQERRSQAERLGRTRDRPWT